MGCWTGCRKLLRLAAVGLSLLAVVGCSSPRSELSPAPRVIRLVASNFGYDPARIEVRRGELVRFIVENPTDLPHEIFIGSGEAQAAHAAELAAPGADPATADAADGAAVYVPPGGVAQLAYRFDDPADTIIGCHLAGHWASGMRAEIALVDR